MHIFVYGYIIGIVQKYKVKSAVVKSAQTVLFFFYTTANIHQRGHASFFIFAVYFCFFEWFNTVIAFLRKSKELRSVRLKCVTPSLW